MCAAMEWGRVVTLRGRTSLQEKKRKNIEGKKERKKKSYNKSHLRCSAREPAFERMDDR
jgi:hypothetical protein